MTSLTPYDIMDVFNNKQGVEYILKNENANDDEIVKYAKNLLKNGKLKIIKKLGGANE